MGDLLDRYHVSHGGSIKFGAMLMLFRTYRKANGEMNESTKRLQSVEREAAARGWVMERDESLEMQEDDPLLEDGEDAFCYRCSCVTRVA